MNPIIKDILTTILPALFVAVVTSTLTVKLALRRFHQERWWEKKQESYSSLLESLHHLKTYASEYYDDQLTPNHITDEKREELHKDWKRFSREFNKLNDLASFLLSEESVEILEEYRKKKAKARKSENIIDWMEGDLAAATECLELLKVSAKKDLKVK